MVNIHLRRGRLFWTNTRQIYICPPGCCSQDVFRSRRIGLPIKGAADNFEGAGRIRVLGRREPRSGQSQEKEESYNGQAEDILPGR
jgi:hypothetical protein